MSYCPLCMSQTLTGPGVGHKTALALSVVRTWNCWKMWFIPVFFGDSICFKERLGHADITTNANAHRKEERNCIFVLGARRGCRKAKEDLAVLQMELIVANRKLMQVNALLVRLKSSWHLKFSNKLLQFANWYKCILRCALLLSLKSNWHLKLSVILLRAMKENKSQRSSINYHSLSFLVYASLFLASVLVYHLLSWWILLEKEYSIYKMMMKTSFNLQGKGTNDVCEESFSDFWRGFCELLMEWGVDHELLSMTLRGF